MPKRQKSAPKSGTYSVAAFRPPSGEIRDKVSKAHPAQRRRARILSLEESHRLAMKQRELKERQPSAPEEEASAQHDLSGEDTSMTEGDRSPSSSTTGSENVITVSA